MARKPKTAPKPLSPRVARALAPGEAEDQVALYEAALRGDNAEFVRLRDGQ